MVDWVCFDFDRMPTVFYTTWLSCDVLNLGPSRILVLLIAHFITFYICRALQQKQHRCIIYCMRCRFLLSENSGHITIWDSSLNVWKSNSNLKTKVQKFELRLKFLTLIVNISSNHYHTTISVRYTTCINLTVFFSNSAVNTRSTLLTLTVQIQITSTCANSTDSTYCTCMNKQTYH